MNLANLTPGQLTAYMENLPEKELNELLAIISTLDKRLYYQLNPLDWIEDRLGIPKHTLRWSLNPGYTDKIKEGVPRVMDDGVVIPNGYDGTPDPIYATAMALAGWRDVVVQSSTGTGKTFLAALITLWFLDVFPDSKVITLAPKEDQLKLNLWGEIHKFQDQFLSEKPKAKFNVLSIEINKHWRAEGFVAAVSAGEEVSSKAAGMHAEHMLFIIDETQGVDKAILEAIENTCTAPHNLRLALGNPRHKEDQLHQLYLREDFVSIRVSSYDHPNVVLNDPAKDVREHDIIVPGAISWKSIDQRRKKYGPEPDYYNNNPTYKALVRGMVPAGSELSLFTEKTLDVLGNRLGTIKKPAKNAPVPILERQPNGEGTTQIFKPTEHTHISRYIMFGDVAEDTGKGDWHACVVLDRITKEVVALTHMRGHREEYVKEILWLAEYYKVFEVKTAKYHYPIVNWERNAGGALHLVKDFADYPMLYMARSYESEDDQKLKKVKGWFTSGKSRIEMIEELKEWGHTLINAPNRMPSIRMLEEMKVFVWDEKKRRFQHMEGKQDDLMMALAGVLITHKLLPNPVKLDQSDPTKVTDHEKRVNQLQKKMTRKIKRETKTPWHNVKLSTKYRNVRSKTVHGR